MAQGDGPPVHVDPFRVDLGVLAQPGEHHGSERLVAFEEVDVGQLHSALGQESGRGVDRTVQEVVGVGAHHHVGHHTGSGAQAVCGGPLGGHP